MVRGVEDAVEVITGGHVTAVKIVVTSVILALAAYQVMLMLVGYGLVRTPFLSAASASVAHRAVGDTIVVLVLLVGVACLAYYGVEDSVEDGAPGPDARVTLHVVAGFMLAGVLALKLLVLHWWRRAQRLLPWLGVSLLALLFVVWLSSAGAFLLGG
jgi:hypothetical protein